MSAGDSRRRCLPARADSPGDAIEPGASLTLRAYQGIVPKAVWRCTPRTPASASVTRSSPQPADAECPGGGGFVRDVRRAAGPPLDVDLGSWSRRCWNARIPPRAGSVHQSTEVAHLDNLSRLVSVAHRFSTDRENAAALGPDDEGLPGTRWCWRIYLGQVSLVMTPMKIPEHGAGGYLDPHAPRFGFPVVL